MEEVKGQQAEEEHVQQVREVCQTTVGKQTARRRPRFWQRPKRQVQARIRRRAVDFCQLGRRQGRTVTQVARSLRLCPRTLRQWNYRLRRQNRLATLLGRPRVRSDYRRRQEVIELLKMEGPTVGVPALREIFPGMARAELTDLLERYRRIVHERYHDTIRVCHWLVPGRVWAMDLAEPSVCGAEESLPPIAGCYPYLLAVRDLASGYQLAWLPLREATAEAVQEVLSYLFARHGAPLVLKSDNGPQFRADEMKRFLERANVIALYSPPYYPQYNGSVEAGIASLKRRTELQAARRGRIGVWTWDDVEAARQEANRATLLQTWPGRTPVTDVERVRFDLRLECERMKERSEQRIDLTKVLDHWQQSAVDRQAIQRALVEHGYLLYSRRRIPLRIKSQKVANIT